VARSQSLAEEMIEAFKQDKLGSALQKDLYIQFFFLTALSIKLNEEIGRIRYGIKDSLILPLTTDLYRQAVAARVPFHQFSNWIQSELYKYVLQHQGAS